MTSAAQSALRKASVRLLPLIGIGYGVAYMDRVNVSFAALQMNQALHFSASVYGLGAGLFFLSYALLEVPSNLLLVRFGARRWLARIMLTWGIISIAMMFVHTPAQFYIARLALGAAEAGFFPGVIFYLSQWFPAQQRSRAVSRFYISLPLATTVMGAIAGALLKMDGIHGLAGWQWLFLIEGIPAVLMSVVFLRFLPDGPHAAKWLTGEERVALDNALQASGPPHTTHHKSGVIKAMREPRIWLMGAFLFLQYLGLYAYTFSAPDMLRHVTGLDVTAVGWLLSSFGVLAALAMLGNGWHSDRVHERYWHMLVPTIIMAAAFFAAGTTSRPAIAVPAFALMLAAFCAVQPVAWTIPPAILSGEAAAAGVAIINTMAICGGYFGPKWLGKTIDNTGTYHHGLLVLSFPILLACGLILLMRWMAKRVAPAAVVTMASSSAAE